MGGAMGMYDSCNLIYSNEGAELWLGDYTAALDIVDILILII